MGYNNYKISYECDCGCDYGSCGRKSYFILRYFRSCDVARLYHKHHAEEPGAKMEYLGCFTDNALDALVKVLTSKDNEEPLSEEDKKEIENL